MLSTSFESSDEEENNYLHDVSQRPSSTEGGSIQDDVERLIEIAAQLFSAIERQIRQIEEELVIACGEHVRSIAQIVFKERLISCAESLETSIQEIALQLERRASQHIVTYGLRDSSQI
jgi:hypothetical protein